jgi:apolipoprotein N-acyltransferase
LRSVAATVASAVLYALAFPPTGWPALSWAALVPLFLAVRGRAPLAAAALGGLFGASTTALIVSWLVPTLQDHFQRPLAWSLAFLAFVSAVAMAPYTALALCAWARARARVRPALAPLLLAAAWVASEWARTQLGIRSPWAKLGDAHFAAERLRQLADLTGVYGVSGLLALGNVACAELLFAGWRRRCRLPAERAPLVACLAIFGLLAAGALLYGELRLAGPRSEDAILDVVLVQGDVEAGSNWNRSAATRVLHRYVGLTHEALARANGDRPDLVVWPENAIQTPLDDPIYGRPVRGLPRHDTSYLLGAPRQEERDGVRRHFNSAFLLRPGAEPEHYDKRRLLPFSETRPFGALGALGARGDLDAEEYTPGGGPGVFRLDRAGLGVLICLEALYPDLAREAVATGADVLVVLSNDGWYHGRGGAEQHLAQVVFRAVETRRPLLRATTTGISALVSPEGRILASIPEGEAGFLRVAVPPGRKGSTPYVRLGDWFPWACLLACALSSLTSRPRRRGS